MLDFSWEYEAVPEEERQRIEDLLKEAERAALMEEAVDVPVECGVTVTDAETVRQMNREYRGIDRTTDVLSFPMLEYPEGPSPETVREGFPDPDTGCVLLGDVVLNYEQAVLQAEEYGHSLERELSFLLVHSLLHLLGYDHMREEDERRMRERQRVIMARLAELTGLAVGHR